MQQLTSSPQNLCVAGVLKKLDRHCQEMQDEIDAYLNLPANVGTEHVPDPYYLRTHFIDPVHGIEHFGALLQPSSWKVGHAPIKKNQGAALLS